MPGKKMKSIRRPRVYEALRAEGMSKSKAAAISNSRPGKKGKKK